MSELFMECEEEELEPWQRRIPEINLVDDDDDDDDEPIFVGEIRSCKVTPNPRPSPAPVVKASGQWRAPTAPVRSTVPLSPVQRAGSSIVAPSQRLSQPPASTQPVSTGPAQLAVRATPQPVAKSLLLPVTSQPGSHPAVAQNVSHTLTAVSPQPIIINNQGYILTSPQIPNNSTFIASLGSQYPSGASFTVLPAGQPLLQQVSPARPVSGVIHRPQVQLIQNNVVTLTSVQSPPEAKQPSAQMSTQFGTANLQPIHTSAAALQPIQLGCPAAQARQGGLVNQKASALALPTLQAISHAGNGSSAVKRDSQHELMSPAKKMKLEMGSSNASCSTQNGTPFRKKCPKCNIQFNLPDPMKSHMKYCCYHLISSVFPTTTSSDVPLSQPLTMGKGKIIMLVTDFYYGKYEGDKAPAKEEKTHTTFKCNSCLKVLKNNIRFMNHMKHHLELEKQSNESWESHTTCQHCYRQYSTPFQLQCHIESAHSPYESTTNCKICELAFESEQALLEHMKYNHKPGEMPYVCQVCNYRSSFFSEVESHFRSVHENTKDLLCPFCLKVLRSGHTYMQHYMRHQKKGIHRCGKCRLNFLTYKEKAEHRIQLHRTFKKPKTLEGLPPGTKVTIRASLSGGSPTSHNSPSKSIIGIVPSSPNSRRTGKPPVGKSKSSSQAANAAKSKALQGRRQERLNSSRQQECSNQALKSLRNELGTQWCVECYSKVKDFYAHYPMVMKCSTCKYQTSCKKSFENHTIRFHSAISRDRFRRMRKAPGRLRSLTLVCLNCDYLEDASGSDLMTKHLIDRPHHTCQVIIEKGISVAEPKKPESKPEVLMGLDPSDSKGGEVKSNTCCNDQSSSEMNGIESKDICDVWDESAVASSKESSENKDSEAQGARMEQQEGSSMPSEARGVSQVENGDWSETNEASGGPGPADARGEDDEPKDKSDLSTRSSLAEGTAAGDGVPFEEFLRKVDKTEPTGSEHGFITLEPLTPSKVLEHEATEILQQGPRPSETHAAESSRVGSPPAPDRPEQASG